MRTVQCFLIVVCICSSSSWLIKGVSAYDEVASPDNFKSASIAAPADEVADTERLSKVIEDGVDDYQLFSSPNASDPLLARPVLRWRNAARGQDGEAMLAIWLDNGRPLAMASIYPWGGELKHEFDLLARQPQLVAKSEEAVIWNPTTADIEFKKMPGVKAPAATPVARLREMKVMAERFEGTMTGWNAADTDNETLRLLPRPIYRYETSPKSDAKDLPLDGALFAFAMGTDPEIVLVLEAVGVGDSASWEYACVRATSGGLEMRLDDSIVWTAAKFPESKLPDKPHFTIGAALPVEN